MTTPTLVAPAEHNKKFYMRYLNATVCRVCEREPCMPWCPIPAAESEYAELWAAYQHALEVLNAAKTERQQLMRVVEAAMIYAHSTMGAQGRYAYQELEKACVRYGDLIDEQCQPDYQHQPGEVEWGLFAEGIDAKTSYERVQQLIAEAKANGR